MAFDDFTGGQRNGTALLQQRVQTDHDARLGDRGGLLKLDHIAVLQCFQEFSLGIGEGLTAGLLAALLAFAQRLYLFGHPVEHQRHAVL